MLVLTRKFGEHIMIGDHITITVARIVGKRVSLQTRAPKNVSVQRQETPLRSGPTSHSTECSMLVLSRKKNESIVINNDITIVIVEIRGDKVRLGIEAPKEMPVHRREVYDAIKRVEQEEAEKAKSQPPKSK